MDENNILNNPEPFAAPVEIEEKVIEPKSEKPAAEEVKASEEGKETRTISALEEAVPEIFAESDTDAEADVRVTFIEADAAEEPDAANEEERTDAEAEVSLFAVSSPSEENAEEEPAAQEEETTEENGEETEKSLKKEEAKAVEFIEADAENETSIEEAGEPLISEGDTASEEPAKEGEAAEAGPVYVEQLSLLEDQLPHLEAANAPKARTAKAVLEGLLFLVGDEGITAEQAAATLDITPELAAEYFDDLMKVYLDEDRGIEIANYGGIYRFLSKAVVHEYAKKLFQVSKQATLSQAALETLAIIAYKQPITRVEIEEIRGVGADMMLRKLMARDLIKESGRSEAAGRPILYEVTDEFMNSFKLMSLKELPELPQFNESEESEDLFNQ